MFLKKNINSFSSDKKVRCSLRSTDQPGNLFIGKLLNIDVRKMPTVATKKQVNGFTLIEALAASGLVSLTIFALVASLHYALTMNATARNRVVAMNDARRVAEQLRIAANTGLSGVDLVPWDNYISHSLANETIQVNTSGTDPLDATIALSWNEKGRTQTIQIDTKVTSR